MARSQHRRWSFSSPFSWKQCATTFCIKNGVFHIEWFTSYCIRWCARWSSSGRKRSLLLRKIWRLNKWDLNKWLLYFHCASLGAFVQGLAGIFAHPRGDLERVHWNEKKGMLSSAAGSFDLSMEVLNLRSSNWIGQICCKMFRTSYCSIRYATRKHYRASKSSLLRSRVGVERLFKALSIAFSINKD